MDKKSNEEPFRTEKLLLRQYPDFLSSPQIRFHSVSPNLRTAYLQKMEPEDYREIGRASSDLVALDLRNLIELTRSPNDEIRPPQFIFMMNFSCSTLLLRLLSAISGVFGSFEPPLFSSLSVARRGNHELWTDTLKCAIRLAARCYHGHGTALIKESQKTNSIAQEILEASPGTRSVFIYSNLKDYLASNLKDSQRVKEAEYLFKREGAAHSGFKELERHVQEDLNLEEYIALRWVTQILRISAAIKRNPKLPVKALNCDELLKAPHEILTLAAEHLGFIVGKRNVSKILASQAFTQYSKDPSFQFDLGHRKEVIDRAARDHQSQISRGMRWAEKVFSSSELGEIPTLNGRWKVDLD